MKQNKKGLKNRILKSLIGIGRKCKILAYPITFFVIAFLAVYHAVRKLFVESEYRKVRTGLLGVLCAAVVIGAVVVLPTLANETGEEPSTEVVAEDEWDPTETPQATVEPVVTEEPETPEPTEQIKQEEKEDEEEQEEKPTAEAKEDDSDAGQATATPETAGAKKDDSDEDASPTQKPDVEKPVRRKQTAKAVKLEAPTYTVEQDGTGVHTYPLSDTFTISIQASAPEGAGIDYQWYMSRTAGGIGEPLSGNGALTRAYTIPKSIHAGDYYYYCVIKSVDNDGVNLDSDEVRTKDIVVSVAKAEPDVSDFDISAIKDEYYYTGEAIDPPVVSKREGMGKAYIVVKDGTTENRPKADRDEPYSIYLHVSEGENYTAKTLDLNKTILIRRIPAPSRPYTIKGTKGKNVNGKQWYTSAVSLVPASGYSISTAEDNFQSELIYSSDGMNQGPEKSIVFLRNNSNQAITSAITVTEKRDGAINIDTVAPEASISYDEAGINDGFSKDEIVFHLTATDAMSGLAKRYYCKSQKVLTDSQLKGASWKEWKEGETVTADADGLVVLYAKVEDAAGNISYASSGELTIDRTLPVITCNKKQLGDEITYVADRKNISVSDTNLKRVTITRNGVVSDTKSGDDIVNGSVQFTLHGANGTDSEVVYIITAEDIAGNQKETTITMKNPLFDVDALDLDFGSEEDALTYGYASVTPLEAVLKIKGTQEKVTVDSVEIEAGDAFEVVPGTITVRPKQGLHTGTHEAVLRVYYNGEEESTTTCRCYVTVKQAKMLVRYTGQEDVGYHTYPDLEGTIEFSPSDFKNGDTLATLKADPGFVMPSLYYQDEEGNREKFTSDMRAMKSMQLIPGEGQATDYVFEYAAGDLDVQRHALRQGYVIVGDRVNGYDWYTSPTVAIRSAQGHYISRTDDEASFAGSEQTITVNGPVNGVTEEFYVMNADTGEISSLMRENIKIDFTPPYFRAGEGITVSTDLFNSFGNTITFGVFFNDTKAVSISATDEESGLETIEYCVSDHALSKDDLETGVEWKQYDNGFSISPEEYERAVIYAKITNHAGLVTYISSNGMVFDNKQPDINRVENGKEFSIVDEQEYVTDELNLKVSDNNLKQATLFEGTNTAASGSALQITDGDGTAKTASRKIPCPKAGSQTYTVVASDEAGNNAEREFTVTKPVYDITANTLKIKSEAYGYESEPQVEVTWENTEKANAEATISDVILSNNGDFEVKQTGESFWIVAKKDLAHGVYTTDVKLIYNGGKEADTTCSFAVNKATLTATYMGGDLYYHEKITASSVKVTGFVKHKGVLETPETAAGYQAPEVVEDGIATETSELTPSGGKADNYKFVYKSGLLLVERRYATTGKDGQYVIDGTVSNSGWYTSDIIIRPKEGYALLLDEKDTKTQESIVLKEDTDSGETSFYVTNTETGEIYYQSTFYYKKDVKAPIIQGIKDEATYEVNTREVTVEDDYLTSVTVNGEARPVENGKAKFTLVAEQETMVYVIVATDCAGNVNDMTVVMNQPAELPVTPEEPKEDNTGATPAPSSTPDANDIYTAKEGTIKKLVKVVQGAPNTSLTTSTNELKKSVLNAGEQQAVGEGSNANIELRIKNIDSSVPQSDKEVIIANLGGYSVGEYLDITLWKKVGSSTEKKVSSTNKPISITVAVPENLQDASRKFAVIRVHNGSASILPDLDSSAKTVTFATDKFSTYVLAYRQQSVSRSSGGLMSANGGRASGTSMYYDASPETGDSVPVIPVSITFIVSLAGIFATLFIRRKSR